MLQLKKYSMLSGGCVKVRQLLKSLCVWTCIMEKKVRRGNWGLSRCYLTRWSCQILIYSYVSLPDQLLEKKCRYTHDIYLGSCFYNGSSGQIVKSVCILLTVVLLPSSVCDIKVQSFFCLSAIIQANLYIGHKMTMMTIQKKRHLQPFFCGSLCTLQMRMDNYSNDEIQVHPSQMQ